jgi:hypothetical protein
MALAEAGYPNADVNGPEHDPGVILSGPNGVPERVCWRAFSVCGLNQACWECWRMMIGEDCPVDEPGIEDCGRDRG